MSRNRVVAVLRGGKSSEYDVSLSSGLHVLKNLPIGYLPLDVLVTKDGVWHTDGLPTTPERVARRADVFFNALRGEYGEDGKVQHILESLGARYTGSKVTPSLISMNKHLSRDRFNQHGLIIPRGAVLHRNRSPKHGADNIFETMNPPWVVKPARSGSSIGVRIARSRKELLAAIDDALFHGDTVVVEEFVRGREATCVVVEGSDGLLHPLPVIEIRKPENGIFHFSGKCDGSIVGVCPGTFSPEENWMLRNVAAQAHNALNLRHYSMADLILSPSGKVYVLEVNSLPGLTRNSLIHRSLNSSGTSFKDFLDHVLTLALARK